MPDWPTRPPRQRHDAAASAVPIVRDLYQAAADVGLSDDDIALIARAYR